MIQLPWTSLFWTRFSQFLKYSFVNFLYTIIDLKWLLKKYFSSIKWLFHWRCHRACHTTILENLVNSYSFLKLALGCYFLLNPWVEVWGHSVFLHYIKILFFFECLYSQVLSSSIFFLFIYLTNPYLASKMQSSSMLISTLSSFLALRSGDTPLCLMSHINIYTYVYCSAY